MAPHSRTVEEITVELEPGDYERLGYVVGKDCAGRFLTFFRFRSPEILAAARDATAKAPGANFLANRHVGIEEKVLVPLIYHEVCVVVEGRAIRLHTAEEAGS